MWDAVGWIGALFAISSGAMPDVSAIQTAYEREGVAGSALHDKGLQVLQSKCHDSRADQFLCEVTFVSKNDPAERLYFDIVAVSRTDGGWQLKSGLCKR